MSTAAQRAAGVASCSYSATSPISRSASHSNASRAATSQQLLQPKRFRTGRGRGLRHVIRADLVSQTLFSEAIAPLAALVPPSILSTVSDALRQGVQAVLSITPEGLQPVVTTLGTDIVTTAELTPSTDSVLRLAAIWYAFFSQPAPALGLLDFYLFGPLGLLLEKKWTTSDLTLRDRMGGGNFGQVFEGVISKNGDRATARELTEEEKRRRVVLKRVNLDNWGVRSNFLQSGTMARGAAETGKVEQYVCSRISRNPWARPNCAQYLGEFTADASEFGFTRGTQWLIWKFESDSTLGDAAIGNLGPFPESLAPYVLNGRGPREQEKRDAAVLKSVMRQVLRALRSMHGMGIVHRDVKPENILVTNKGQVKIIDFGAAVDMCTGINFNPQSGMLDPKYSPPEEMVMPEKTPKAPFPALAITLAPFLWLWGRPDLFDTYSAGVLMLQLAIPELRAGTLLRNLQLELRTADYDLNKWRQGDIDGRAKKYDFALLDRGGGAGWDLAAKLIRKRNALYRGRLSAAQALRHRYFSPLG